MKVSASQECAGRDRMRGVGTAALLSVVLPGGLYWLIGHIAVHPSDEGFLWYGVIQTAAGEIPLRDFQSYDPGRYYWCAAWSLLLGDGLAALRLSVTLFQVLGVFCGLLAARRITQRPALLTLIGCVLVLWMFPPYKFFEHSLAMMAVYFAARLLEDPGLGRHFVAGLFVGLAAFFGRNHGLYCGLAFLLVILLLHWKRRGELPLLKDLAVWSGGILLGVSPLLAMLIFVPDFAASFFRSLVDFVPLSLSIQWPWQLPEGAHSTRLLGAIGVFVCYIALVVAYPLGLLVAWFTKPDRLAARSVLIASVCIGVFYSHHVWGRADHNHLAQGIHPLLLGLLAAPVALGWGVKGIRARAIWIGVVSITGVVALIGFQRPLGAFGIGPLGGVPYVQYDLRGDTLLIPATTARRFDAVEAVVHERVRADEPLLVVPHQTIYYPLLGRVTPVWTLYFLRRGEGETDAELIDRLEAEQVDWALFTGERRGRLAPTLAELRPAVAAYLEREFEPLSVPNLPNEHVLLQRRKATGSPGRTPHTAPERERSAEP